MAASPVPAVALYPAICPGHQKAVVELQYRATPDGVFFISACLDKLPMVREGVTGDWVGSLEGHKGAVWSAKLDAAACRAATGSADFTAKVWDALTGDVVATLEHGHVVKSVDLSADGRTLVTGCHDKKLRIYDLGRPDAPPTVFSPGEKLRRVLWSRGEQQVVTGSEDGALRVFDVRTGTAVALAQLGAAGVAVTDIELSPDGSALTAACGSCVALCDAQSLAVTKKHALDFTVEAASLHPGGLRRLVVGGTDVSVRVLDADSGCQLASHKGHHGAVHCVRFAPDGETFSSGADDATVRIWKLDDGSASGSQALAASSARARSSPAPLVHAPATQ